MVQILINAMIIFSLGLVGILPSGSDLNNSHDRVVTVPILVYHSIPNSSAPDSRYEVSKDNFNDQMEQLRYWGYSTITVEQLVNHINRGHSLPPRPIVISFDDGYLDVYENAFPIMEKFGFTRDVTP